MTSEASVARKEVSESAFEYLIGEILNVKYPGAPIDNDTDLAHRLENIGHDVGYR
jgi:hypothetical protein